MTNNDHKYGHCDCNQPFCNEGGIQCVSSEVWKGCSLCGELNPDDNKYYLVKTETMTDGGTKVTTHSLDPDTCECSHETVCSGSYTITITTEFECYRSSDGERVTITQTATGEYTINADCSVSSTSFEYSPDDIDPDNEYSYCVGGAPSEVQTPTPLEEAPAPVYSVSSGDIEVPLPEFPEYPEWGATSLADGQGLSCNAEYIETAVKDDHGNITYKSVSYRKVKWRGWNRVTATCYYKHWVMQRTETEADPDAEPPVEASVSTTEAGTWEWIGTGNPCIPVPTSPRESDDNKITEEASDEIIVVVTGQTVEVGSAEVGSAIYYSCVPGYTPVSGDPTKPDGYPCPGCEAEAP